MHRLMVMTAQTSLFSGSGGSPVAVKKENNHQYDAHSAEVSGI